MPRTRLTVTPLDARLTPTALPAGFSESLLAGGLTAPTALAVAPDGRAFVAEQTGGLRVVRDGTLLPTPFATLTVDGSGERGLIGVTLDPDFAANGFVYLYHTVPASGGTPAFNRVSRFTAAGDVAVAGSERVLLDLDPLAATNHNGGAMQFGADGKLYVAVGENAIPANSQSLANRLGKILRLNPDGSIPADNPTTFAGLSGTTSGANRAIWAVGFRNPFSMAVQPGTGRLLVNDVGQSAFEEVDAGRAGANYGWPATEGDFDQAAFPAFTRPLTSYPHGSGSPAVGNSVVGAAFYNPRALSYPAEYTGQYFFADLTGKWVNRLDPATGAVTNFATDLTGGLPIALAVSPAGDLLYVARGDAGGGLYRVRYAATPIAGSSGPTVAVGLGAGSTPSVTTYDPATGKVVARFLAFEPTFRGGVRVATADVTGDRVPDVLAGAGPGGGPRVRVFDGSTGVPVLDRFVFEPTFTGGVTVASADLDRDGYADLLVGADRGGGPRVRVLSGRTGATLADFYAFETTFTGGVRLAAGDTTGDGVPDLIVAAGTGGGPRVAVFDGRSVAVGNPQRAGGDFFAFEPALRDGTNVAAGDVDGDGRADLIVGSGDGGGPRVLVFGGAAGRPVLADFFAGDDTTRRGVVVGAADVDGDGRADVLAATPSRLVAVRAGAVVRAFAEFDDAVPGGVFVG